MAWSISHTMDAWENVRARIQLKKWKPTLALALHDDDEAKHEEDESHEVKGLRFYQRLPQCDLVSAIIERIEEHMLCTNGGHEFYLDRNGNYTVSCDDLSPAEERAILRS